MDNVRRIGLRSIPQDANIATVLYEMKKDFVSKTKSMGIQLEDTLEQTIRNQEPPIFAFGKMLNYLATLEKPELIELLAGYMWKVNGF